MTPDPIEQDVVELSQICERLGKRDHDDLAPYHDLLQFALKMLFRATRKANAGTGTD